MLCQPLHFVDKRSPADDHAAHEIGVPAEIFRRTFHDHVGAVLERLLVDNRGKRIIDHDRDSGPEFFPGPPRQADDLFKIDQAEGRIGRGLYIDDFRPGGQEVEQVVEGIRLDIADADLKGRERVAEEAVTPSVEGRGADHLISGPANSHDRS